MWKFFSELWWLFTASPSPQPDAEIDREFTFHEEPLQIPDELKNLQVERLTASRDTLLLRNFDVDMTADQTARSDDPKAIAWSCRALRWAAKYHGLDTEATAPVRLHRENVLLLRSWFVESNPNDVQEILSNWQKHFDWPAARPFSFQQTLANSPVEDGFFRCIRVCVSPAIGADNDNPRLGWEDFTPPSANLSSVLKDFMQEEIDRIGNPERYIEHCYEAVPHDQLTHPAFALMEYPTFDEMVVLEFTGSIWSPNELRFWSRARHLHN